MEPSDRRHIIPDKQYIEEYSDEISKAFLELAASVQADDLDRHWFHQRVADSIEHIRDARAFDLARRNGEIHPTAREIAQNDKILDEARRELFTAIQELISVSRYLFLRET
jgi:hypothetical protein